MGNDGDENSIQVCKCGLLLSDEKPIFTCDRCGVTWSLDAQRIGRAWPVLKPTHPGPESIN